MKIVTVVGARPQFIKAAAVSREIRNHPDIKEVMIHTGQHFDRNMSGLFFEEMQIPRPDHNLDIHSMNHGAMTGRMMEGIEEILIKEDPDFVMVFGDTNSTLAGALAAKKLHMNVVHIEAGLRSFNMLMPEEINRILTDRISDVLCCPTDKAVENLKQEGYDKLPCEVIKTGDVMQDAALFYSRISAMKSNVMERLKLGGKDFALCTVHRAENTDDKDRLINIIDALNEIAADMEVVIPVHPRTRKIIDHLAPELKTNNLKLIGPVGYFDIIELLKHARIVLTDSGGLQKEAFFFKRPCVTLRDETEWVELIVHGLNALAGADKEKIIATCHEMKERRIDFNINLYGDGLAGRNTIDVIRKVILQ